GRAAPSGMPPGWCALGQALKRWSERARALAASTSRSFGGAVVWRWFRSQAETRATSSTAASKTASLTFDGLVKPLILRTYCSAAARISSSVAGGSKLKSGRMFLHMGGRLAFLRIRTNDLYV